MKPVAIGPMAGWCSAHIRASRAPLLATALAALLAATLAGCVENPVTGERELRLVGTSDEIAIGNQQYEPSQQMQGGEYALDPELEDYVRRVGQKLAAVSDRDLPYQFVVLNSSVPNAWALPGGKIAVNRGLLATLDNEAELAAVLGHEITHAAAGHGAQAMQRGMLTQGALTAAAVAMSASGYDQYSNVALSGAQLGAQLITQKYGRDAELEADHYGMVYMKRAGYDPQAAVTLQEKFVKLAEGHAQDWLSGLFASHPPSEERVAKNRAFAAQLGTGGELGRERYQAATAALRKREPAYELGDQASKALQAKDYATALSKARAAIAKVPGEARFHGLAGDALAAQKDYRKALAEYDQAVKLDPGYYVHWQQRAMANLALDNDAAAQSDLQHAVDLLPTAQGMNALGQLALQDGRTDAARQYLQAAAGGSGSAAEQARASLARLDLPTQPGAYLPLRFGLDGDGNLVAQLANQAPFPVRDIVLELRVRSADGRIASRTIEVPGGIGAGASRTVRTGVQLAPDTASGDLDLRVVQARPAD